MDLTIEQALQQGVAAHQEGKLQEAERLYRAILQSQPFHTDANHNLGVLLVSVNKAVAALPLFKTALEANPEIEQFWLSYIEVLIIENQFDNAKQVLEQAKNQELDREALKALESELALKIRTQNVNSENPSQQQLSKLLEYYQAGQYGDAEKLAVSLTEKFPEHIFSWNVLGAIFYHTDRILESLVANQKIVQLAPQDAKAHNNLGITLKELCRFSESENSFAQAIALKPDYAEAHNNLGVTLQELGKLDEAEASYTKAIALNPDYAAAHSNLGNTLKELGRFDEAEASYTQAIALNPDLVGAHYNLGNALQKLRRFDEAEASYTQAIALKPDYAEAHSNLGVTLQELGRLEEAEASYTQAITLKPDYAEAHGNLGNTLRELGRLEEAEASCRQAIALKADFALAHSNLGKVLYATGDKSSALSSVKRANVIDPKSKEFSLLLSVLQARKARENTKSSVENIIISDRILTPPSKILLLNRSVEEELTAYLYSTELLELDKEKDPSFGDTRGSKYDLFEDNHPTIQNLVLDLNSILMKSFNSDIFIHDSFFSIFSAGGGTGRHSHVDKFDNDSTFDLYKQKYALVYYLSVGDQECAEPGVLKFYEPSEDILPSKGLITIFPADRYHSSVYGGNKDRVIVGVNFYIL
jgi:tetratricopeptide (TPR) repeat protein